MSEPQGPRKPKDPLRIVRAGSKVFNAWAEWVRHTDPGHYELLRRRRRNIRLRQSQIDDALRWQRDQAQPRLPYGDAGIDGQEG